jgi:hypothetical protein
LVVCIFVLGQIKTVEKRRRFDSPHFLYHKTNYHSVITRVLVALITTQWGNHRHIPLFLAFPSISRKICDLLNVPTQQSPINSARIRSSKVTKYRLEDGRCIISRLHNPDLNTMNGDRLFFQRNNTDLCRFNCDAQRGVRYALKLDRMESLQL